VRPLPFIATDDGALGGAEPTECFNFIAVGSCAAEERHVGAVAFKAATGDLAKGEYSGRNHPKVIRKFGGLFAGWILRARGC